MGTESSSDATRIDLQAPLTAFSDCHQGIAARLATLVELPPLLEPMSRAQRIAADTVALFERVVLVHHGEEEAELFPAVLRASEKGAERERVRALIERLMDEHRTIEGQWRKLEPRLAALAKGSHPELTPSELQGLVDVYQAHARFEEQEFLPLCDEILRRGESDMSMLGLSIHMRRHSSDEGF
ncbi:MAG TPA: hemerythrin domain-containing protein [Burkholderiales bacterium]|nr:hemerythrin domain-containing protein [Burkholderiales bacterium]